MALEVVVVLALIRVKSDPSPPGDVVIRSPQSGDLLTSPFTIRGTARTFENNVVVQRYVDLERWEMVAGPVMAESESLLEPGTFSVEVSLPPGRHHLRVGDHPPVDTVPFIGAELVVEIED